MNKNRISILVGCLILLIFMLLGSSGCAALPQVAVVEGEERDQVISISDPIAENIFLSMNAGDYSAFARDFDDPMKKALNEKSFNEMMAFFNPKIGSYQSRKVDKVELIDNLYVVSYTARYENEDSVSARLSLRPIEDTYQVAGLWFDSPKLREK